MSGVNRRAGAAVAKVPTIVGDVAAGLVEEIDHQRRLPADAILRKGRDGARDGGVGRHRCWGAVLHPNLVYDSRQAGAVTQIDPQPELVQTVLAGGGVPDTQQAIDDRKLHYAAGREPDVTGVGVWPVFKLILQKLWVAGRA